MAVRNQLRLLLSVASLFSGRQVGCVVLEVVGCWAESIANQQRIARDSDQGLKSESKTI
jgi:hypothetical protein